MLKAFRRGTQRIVSPAETLARVRPHLAAMGITRIANVTDLDRVGVPVVTVCRPNARSVVMAHGKGLDLVAAKTSGVMESIELYHAEHMASPLKLCAYGDLRRAQPVVDVDALLRMRHSRFHSGLQILWVEGHDLLQGDDVWLPYETVHMNWITPVPSGSGCFPRSSTGLASGNHRLEAISHVLCEVIERDAITLWLAMGDEPRAETRVDPRSIDDPDCRSILASIERAGLLAALWDATSDMMVPTIVCTVTDAHANDGNGELMAEGTGCHPIREVAALRAMTEALQSRLVRIAGVRDGLRRSQATASQFNLLARMQADTSGRKERTFRSVPSFVADTLDGDVAWLLARVAAGGVTRVIVVDLTLPEFAIPVVRVVVPGLEDGWDTPDYRPGPRASRPSSATT